MTDAENTVSDFAMRRAGALIAGQQPWRHMTTDSLIEIAISAHAARLHRRALMAAIDHLRNASGRPGVAAALLGLGKGDVETAEAMLAGWAADQAEKGDGKAAARCFRHMAALVWLTDPHAAAAPLDQALDLAPDDVPTRRLAGILALALRPDGQGRALLERDPVLHPEMGFIHLRQGDRDAALQVFADAAGQWGEDAAWLQVVSTLATEDDADRFDAPSQSASVRDDPSALGWAHLFRALVRLDQAPETDINADIAEARELAHRSGDAMLADLTRPAPPDGVLVRLRPLFLRVLKVLFAAAVLIGGYYYLNLR